ncbi:MAG: aminotransferase class IV [Acidobacteria bacterium]|nr:aminotransferase class IV [Acidobacteriota bacterium]MCA1627454.1 aminotransferase class IV [Acidobacteriota bacterium]
MHPVIYLNKTMVEATKARVAPVSSAMLYGRGVFTTVAIYDAKPFLWSKHWQRLTAHAAKLDIDHTGCTEKSVGDAMKKLIAFNQVKDGRARVIMLARSGRDTWRTKTSSAKKTDLLIMTGDPPKAPPNGLSLAVSPFRTNTFSPLTGIKSLNYLSNVLAWEEAQSRDFDEAVVLNERGEIASATTANLFWVKNGTVHTPTLSTGAMAGVTRECVIDIASKHFIPLLEGIYEIGDLTDADEIFLTSAGLGVAPVTTFDFRRYAVEPSSVTRVIAQAFAPLTRDPPRG